MSGSMTVSDPESETVWDREYYGCDCGYPEHHMLVDVHGLNEDEEPEISFYVYLNQYRGFWSRVWTAIKYVFGYRCRYGH